MRRTLRPRSPRACEAEARPWPPAREPRPLRAAARRSRRPSARSSSPRSSERTSASPKLITHVGRQVVEAPAVPCGQVAAPAREVERIVAQLADPVLRLPAACPFDAEARAQRVVHRVPEQLVCRRRSDVRPLDRLAEEQPELRAARTECGGRREREVELEAAGQQEDAVDARRRSGDRIAERASKSVDHGLRPVARAHPPPGRRPRRAKVRSRSDQRSPSATASEPTTAPATTRSSAAAKSSTRSRTRVAILNGKGSTGRASPSTRSSGSTATLCARTALCRPVRFVLLRFSLHGRRRSRQASLDR